jgi:hypothetical protein
MLLNLPRPVLTSDIAAYCTAFLPILSKRELPLELSKHTPLVKCEVFHRSIRVLSESLVKKVDSNGAYRSICFTGNILYLGIFSLKTHLGDELFYPVLVLFCGDMLVLLSASRMMSSGFSDLMQACYVCGIAGWNLDSLDVPATRLSAPATDAIINSARQDILDRNNVTAAWKSLRDHSFLPVEVCTSPMKAECLTVSSVEWVYWASVFFNTHKSSLRH